MSRVLIAVALIAGCKAELSTHAHCVKRQMAWEAAFPELPETEAQRERFVESCAQQPPEQLVRSMRCMEDHLTGRREIKLEYLELTRCEAEAKP